MCVERKDLWEMGGGGIRLFRKISKNFLRLWHELSKVVWTVSHAHSSVSILQNSFPTRPKSQNLKKKARHRNKKPAKRKKASKSQIRGVWPLKSQYGNLDRQ